VEIGVRYARSNSLKTRLVRHVFPVHGLACLAAIHNYLAFIFTAFGRPWGQAIPVGAQVSDDQTCR
jgi:hypothetical protein